MCIIDSLLELALAPGGAEPAKARRRPERESNPNGD
jgi:hypothetical protein